MICNQRPLLIFFFAAVAILPAAVLAQGNHCVAQKSPVKMAVAAGQPVYASRCQTCHQADGAGLPDMSPSLIKTRLVTEDKQALIELMLTGHQQHAVKEEQKFKQEMPAYPEMTDEEIANVLTYVRRNFGNKASMVKISEVKKLRETSKPSQYNK